MIRIAYVIVALAFASGTANTQPKIEKGPIKATPASDAQKMFDSYCAVCHGTDAKGRGPAAASLKKAPADLTRIAERNAGAFPEVRVKRYIEGADEVAAHGSRDMPVWGGLFSALDRDTKEIRIQALADYLKGIQLK